MKLYHFTSVGNLPSIIRNGLSLTHVPLNLTESDQAIWLTNTSDPGHGDDHGIVDKKREIRMNFDIPVEDPLLVKWTKYASQRKLSKKWLFLMDVTAGFKSVHWYLYFKTIPINSPLLVSIDRLNEKGEYVPLFAKPT